MTTLMNSNPRRIDEIENSKGRATNNNNDGPGDIDVSSRHLSTAFFYSVYAVRSRLPSSVYAVRFSTFGLFLSLGI